MSSTDTSRSTPTSTPSASSAGRLPSVPGTVELRELKTDKTMADVTNEENVSSSDHSQDTAPVASSEPEKIAETRDPQPKRRTRCKKPEHKHKMTKAAKQSEAAKQSRDDSSDSDDESEELTSEESDSSSEDERAKRKAKRAAKHKKAKDKKRRKAKVASDTEVEDSNANDSSSENEPAKKRKKLRSKKTRRLPETESEDATSQSDDASDDSEGLAAIFEAIRLRKARPKQKKMKKQHDLVKPAKLGKKTSKKTSVRHFKRVDELWDNTIHNYKLKESAEDDESEFGECGFLVRRTFNWENKYICTFVDIKAKPLRAALTDVMKECKSVSLEAEEPVIDPNILFLYLEELRTHYRKTLKTELKAAKKKKDIKRLELQRSLLKSLISYLDEDYADIKKKLYPLLEAGNITFDLLWALFHPNDIAVTSTYGVWDEPRCFKVEYANKECSMMRGEWYTVEGKYLEYDGKNFGYGDFEVEIDSFKGPRKISSLATYPLKYHKDPASVKKQILERGRRFVQTEGMNYRFHKGLAFMKKKKQVLKININGRIMIDPAIFRRINPNYSISYIRPRESEELFSWDGDESDECSCCEKDSDDEGPGGRTEKLENRDGDNAPKHKYKFVEDERGDTQIVQVEVDSDGEPVRKEALKKCDEPLIGKQEFSEEELLLTSSVVLGFAFSEKLWLEFTLSGVHDIQYNDAAFDSLVLPPEQKTIVKALVTSHKFHAAKTIDDVVQGKGRGLVAVLHGPPGTGKTLTAEGISELLRCPLYMVSAGELGTDPAKLEYELQKILDIAHSWGALLLLDEADVFLEKREVHDIHRNALVSIFLRQLEYFQGILFLTTNRVETFDEAFQSRIHLPLKYTELSPKAKKTIWNTFIELVRKSEGTEVADFSDWDLEILSRNQLNGRQIKNVVRTAQALALNEGSKLDLALLRRVLDVEETFDRDLKGGTGYIDAMRSYT